MKQIKNKKEQAKEFDWEQVYKNLKKLELGLDDYDENIVKQILKDRADALSISPKTDTLEDFYEVVVFQLGTELYAIESIYIKEVYVLKDLTTVPGVPAFVLGVINCRGQILSVIDLKKFFGLPDKALTNLNKVIIVRNEEIEFGILADEIKSIRIIYSNELQAPLPTMSGKREEYLKGVTKESLAFLDGAKILSDKNIILTNK